MKHSIPFIILFMLVVCPYAVEAQEIQGLRAEASSFKLWGTPDLLVDDDSTTAWVGGRQGVGPGKWVRVILPQAREITMIRIANGNQGKGKFDNFQCVRNGVLLLPDRGAYFFSLKAAQGEQDIVFPPVMVESFDLIITDVAAGAGHVAADGKVAVSEIRVFDTAPEGRSATVLQVSGAPLLVANSHVTKMPYFSALKPGNLWLLGAVPTDQESALQPGVVDRSLAAGAVAHIQEYFEGLVSLDDGVLNVFAPSVRQREMDALHVLRKYIAKRGLADRSKQAAGDSSGLYIDKPVIRGDAAMVPVHGVYRFASGGKVYQFPVNVLFSMVLVEGEWLINGVQKK